MGTLNRHESTSGKGEIGKSANNATPFLGAGEHWSSDLGTAAQSTRMGGGRLPPNPVTCCLQGHMDPCSPSSFPAPLRSLSLQDTLRPFSSKWTFQIRLGSPPGHLLPAAVPWCLVLAVGWACCLHFLVCEPLQVLGTLHSRPTPHHPATAQLQRPP